MVFVFPLIIENSHVLRVTFKTWIATPAAGEVMERPGDSGYYISKGLMLWRSIWLSSGDTVCFSGRWYDVSEYLDSGRRR